MLPNRLPPVDGAAVPVVALFVFPNRPAPAVVLPDAAGAEPPNKLVVGAPPPNGVPPKAELVVAAAGVLPGAVEAACVDPKSPPPVAGAVVEVAPPPNKLPPAFEVALPKRPPVVPVVPAPAVAPPVFPNRLPLVPPGLGFANRTV